MSDTKQENIIKVVLGKDYNTRHFQTNFPLTEHRSNGFCLGWSDAQSGDAYLSETGIDISDDEFRILNGVCSIGPVERVFYQGTNDERVSVEIHDGIDWDADEVEVSVIDALCEAGGVEPSETIVQTARFANKLPTSLVSRCAPYTTSRNMDWNPNTPRICLPPSLFYFEGKSLMCHLSEKLVRKNGLSDVELPGRVLALKMSLREAFPDASTIFLWRYAVRVDFETPIKFSKTMRDKFVSLVKVAIADKDPKKVAVFVLKPV